jgi:hypothetical protein
LKWAEVNAFGSGVARPERGEFSAAAAPVFERYFALQGKSPPLVSPAGWYAIHALPRTNNQSDPPMKIALIAATAAFLAASCCPSAAPAPSKPGYVSPSK